MVATENPFLLGNSAPVGRELTATDLPTKGQIPAELHGRYVRTGPNPYRTPDGPERGAIVMWNRLRSAAQAGSVLTRTRLSGHWEHACSRIEEHRRKQAENQDTRDDRCREGQPFAAAHEAAGGIEMTSCGVVEKQSSAL